MIINLKIEITEKEIIGFLREYPQKNIQDLLGEINNTVYLGGDCIAAMMMRLHDINCEHYIEKSEVANQLDYLAKISDDVFYARLMSEKNKSQMGDLMRDEDSETYEKIMSNK